MTLHDWFGPIASSELHSHLITRSDRKLHLLTAAFLRRVWDDLPSHHTRTAVEATEAHADGRMSARGLARLRSADLLETCEALWTDPGYLDEDLIGLGCPCCDWGPRTTEYECRVARNGYVLDGVDAAVNRPAGCAVRAARYARELVRWKCPLGDRAQNESVEAEAQYDLFLEIAGPSPTDPNWPGWRTSDVCALARGIHLDQAFDRLPILADALQDAGCDNKTVLEHCRRPGGHVRGC